MILKLASLLGVSKGIIYALLVGLGLLAAGGVYLWIDGKNDAIVEQAQEVGARRVANETQERTIENVQEAVDALRDRTNESDRELCRKYARNPDDC